MSGSDRRKRENVDASKVRSASYLDDFSEWLGSSKHMEAGEISERRQHAEALVEFLHVVKGKECSELDELDLRQFLYNHAIALWVEPIGAQGRLPASVALFYEYLEQKGVFDGSRWLKPICSDIEYYLSRCRSFRNWENRDSQWEEHFAAWCDELDQDLYRRCLLPAERLDGETVWSENMGEMERRIHRELASFLVKRRKELMESGVKSFHTLRNRLEQLQKAWLARPKKRFGGRSPLELVKQEQERNLVPQ